MLIRKITWQSSTSLICCVRGEVSSLHFESYLFTFGHSFGIQITHCIVLLLSGFNRDDVWGYRALEPSRCCISSIALVLLKTGITHNPSAASRDDRVAVDYAQMSTAQKLLLFWRKPAVRIHTILLYFSIS